MGRVAELGSLGRFTRMHSHRIRWFSISLAVVFIAALVGWFWLRRTSSSRVQIHDASAADSPQRLASVLVGPQPLRTTRWRELFVEDDPYLKIGPGRLQWSTRSPGNGYLYFHTSSSVPDWEFAPCSRKALGDITDQDVRCDFFGPDHPNGRAAFGTSWNSNSIVFTTGQVVLARWLKSTGMVYAVKIEEQKGQTLRVRYAEFDAANERK